MSKLNTTSVVGSARSSMSSVLDVVGNSANAVNQLINTGIRGIDMLDLKVSVTHTRVAEYTKHALKTAALEERTKAIAAHAEFQHNLINSLGRDEQLKAIYQDLEKNWDNA